MRGLTPPRPLASIPHNLPYRRFQVMVVGQEEVAQLAGGGDRLAGAPIRTIGASRASTAASATSALISAPMPPIFQASWAMTRRFVLRTERRIVSRSSGARERGSITSTEIPSTASRSATASARWTSQPVATTVASLPSRTTRAVPMGSGSSRSGTFSWTAW